MRSGFFPWDTEKRSGNAAANPAAIASCLRIARNLRGMPFPCNASPAQKLDVLDRVRKALADSTEKWTELNSAETPDYELELLEESRILPPGFRKERTGKAMFTANSGAMEILVNGEDHVQIQAFAPGLALKKLWETLDELDNFLAERLPFVYHARFGFLTADPANAGTALKASVLLHLPALLLTGGNKILGKAAGAMNLSVRGFFGEKTKITGNLHQISNRSTMGESEPEITERITSCTQHIADQEIKARELLQKNHSARLMDFCARASAVLASAHLISTEEAMNALSGIRLAVETGLIHPPRPFDWNKILLTIQPCHAAPSPCTPEKRAEKRADFLRSVFGGNPAPSTERETGTKEA